MNKLIQPGKIIYALGMAALGILCFIYKDFIIGRPPAWPAGVTVNPALAYIGGALIIVAAIAILVKKNAEAAALLIAGLVFLLSALRHFPHFMNDWANAYKTLALAGGSLIIAASVSGHSKSLRGYFILAGSVLLAAFFIAAGYAHFKYADFVKTLIPAFIPMHEFWTYFTGICLLAGGVGILIPGIKKWAALLSGIMVAGWFLLLHIPRFLANTNDASDRMGVFESFTFAGIFFVLAGLLSRKE